MAENNEEYIREDCLDNEEMRKIFVAGIPSDAQDDAFKSFFEDASGGAVTNCSLVRKDGQKNIIAFVTFETSELVDEVLLKRGSLSFNGKELDVKRAVPKSIQWVGAHEKTKKLFIANLPRDTKEDDLEKYLKARHPTKYGKIESVQLIKEKNPDGSRKDINKGYGFIFVSSEDMADKMAIQHQNFTFGGREIEMKKNVVGGDGSGGRGRGRGGVDRGTRGGRGGGQFQGYGGYNGGSGGGQWAADPYAAGNGGGYGSNGGGYGSNGGGYGSNGGGYGGFGGGYDGGAGYGGGYGGGYGASTAAAAGGGGGGHGRGRGGNRFQPY